MSPKVYEELGHDDLDSATPFIQHKEASFLTDAASITINRRRFGRIVLIQWVVIFIVSLIAVGGWLTVWNNRGMKITNVIYSPAQDVVRYRNIVFSSGFGTQKTKYMGVPSPENNQAWGELYNLQAITKIPMKDAAKLVNKTTPLPESPGYYVVGLDVFHQLHCLNGLRKRLWGVVMHNMTSDKATMDHFDHCIDSLRQSLMCSSDISVIAWKWNEKQQIAMAQADMIHTCRDFEAIRQWALNHQAGAFNRSIYIPDPLAE